MPVASPVTIHNEQVKLFAACLERIGTAILTVGVFTPIAAAAFRIPGFIPDPLNAIFGSMAFLLVAILFYVSSQRTLQRLAQ